MSDRIEQHEVIIIGAGVCGIYMLHRMLELVGALCSTAGNSQLSEFRNR